jgi:hypothetical protein
MPKQDGYYEQMNSFVRALEAAHEEKIDLGTRVVAYGLAMIADSIGNTGESIVNGVCNTLGDGFDKISQELELVRRDLSSIDVRASEGIAVTVESVGT